MVRITISSTFQGHVCIVRFMGTRFSAESTMESMHGKASDNIYV